MTQVKPLGWSLTVAAIASVILPGITMAQAVPKTLRRGMPYAQARQMLMNAGWQAVEQVPDRDRPRSQQGTCKNSQILCGSSGSDVVFRL